MDGQGGQTKGQTDIPACTDSWMLNHIWMILNSVQILFESKNNPCIIKLDQRTDQRTNGQTD